MVVTRYTFTGTLELVGALHIGSGGGGRIGVTDIATDATIVRDSRGQPYIPGSSLRGMLRAAISQYAPGLLNNPRLGQLRDEDELRDVQQILAEEVRVAEDAAQQRGDRFDPETKRQEVLDVQLSPTERLFGTVLWASPLHIPDLHLREPDQLAGEIRHGVGIDRDTGAAKAAVKYDFEVLPRGVRFGFWMRCEIPSTPASYRQEWLRMLALGLRLLEQGELTLGGRAARGVGQVRLLDLQVYALDTGDRSALLNTLLAEADEERYGTPLPDGWARHVLQEVR